MSKSIKSKLLGKPTKFKSETVEVEGELLEVRQPSLRQRSEIRSKAMNMDLESKTAKFNMFEFLIWSVIYLTFDKDGAQVFDEADYEALSELPSGGWFDELSEAASKLMNVDSKEAGKSSDKLNIETSM